MRRALPLCVSRPRVGGSTPPRCRLELRATDPQRRARVAGLEGEHTCSVGAMLRTVPR